MAPRAGDGDALLMLMGEPGIPGRWDGSSDLDEDGRAGGLGILFEDVVANARWVSKSFWLTSSSFIL